MSPNPSQPPNQTPVNRRQQVKNWGQKVVSSFSFQPQKLANFFPKTFGKFILSFRRINQRDQIVAAILLLIWIAILLSNFYFRGNYVFEGNLLVSEMSFTYTGKTEKRFLNPIRNLKNLDLQGSQTQPLILTGKFSSSDPKLNQKISKLNKLTLELPYPTSRLILKPAKPASTNELSVLELRLNPESQINQLAYNSQPAQLSFCLQAVSMTPDACRFPDSLLNNSPQPKSQPVGKLKLQLGQQQLNVSIGAFHLRELNLKTDINTPNELFFQFTPTIDEVSLNIISPTRLLIDLPNLSKAQSKNPPQWIRGDIDVKNVNFLRFDITENVTDELKTSTILDGEVRMGSQSMKLQSDQFLILPPNQTGIRKLRYIQINPQSPEGLRSLISGKSNNIAVGLYPEFPVQKIELSWLSKYFSQEAISAFLALIGAFTGIFLPRLFPEPTDKKNPKKRFRTRTAKKTPPANP